MDELTDAQYDEMKKNFSDREWRLRNLYYILDEKGHKVKFKLRYTQRLLLNSMWFLNLILKSRQHGITTFLCILFLDICLFNSNKSAGIVADTLLHATDFFENKIKFAYDNLPPQLRNELPLVKDTAMVLKLANGSSITVGTSLRSGTYQYLHISEFGKICAKFPEKAREIVTGALNTVHVGMYIFIESTAEGRSGYFFDYCMEALNRQKEGKEPNQLQFKLLFFPWWRNPLNVMEAAGVLFTSADNDYFEKLEATEGIRLEPEQKAWYVSKARQQGEDMLREHPSTPEEAFKASIMGAYYQKQMVFLRKQRPCRIGTVPYDPALPVNTGWDFGIRASDTTCIVFHQRYGLENRIIDFEEGHGEPLAHFVKILQEKDYVYDTHYLPHDGAARDSDLVTKEAKLNNLGLKNTVIVPRVPDISDAIEEVRKFLITCWFDEVHCERLIAALDEYRKEWDEKNSVYRSTPLHNWASNPEASIRSIACGYVYRSEQKKDRNQSTRPRGGMAA